MDQLERPAPAAPAAGDPGQGSAVRRRRAWPWLAAVAGVVVLALIFVLTRSSSDAKTLSPAQIASTVQSVVDKGIAAAKAEPPDSVTVYQTILPSLVIIRSERAASPGAKDETGLGTGVVIDDQGSILTAHHVIANATSIEVSFVDGTTTKATVSKDQPENDIAVLQPASSPATLVPATLGGASGLHVGDATYAVGNPLGLAGSMSAGVISGLDRSIDVQGGTKLQGLIQFDAAVNPGSSGGPLLNRDGQVIGIVTALANPSEQGFFIGIGFAIPITTAARAAGAPAQ